MLFHILKFICLSLSLNFIPSAGCMYTTINTRQHQVVFKYAKEHRSERDLPICGETEVCSILHKRFWLPPLSERLCRCTNNDECPWKWTENKDNHTMFLNSRSQLKFCSSTQNFKPCNYKESALSVTTTNANATKTRNTVSVNCYCSSDIHYWKQFKTTQKSNKINLTSKFKTEYKCALLKKCDTREFCGHVRVDQSSIFYTCSCPEGHFCIYKNQTKHNVEELLYKGLAYKAICEPNVKIDDYD